MLSEAYLLVDFDLLLPSPFFCFDYFNFPDFPFFDNLWDLVEIWLFLDTDLSCFFDLILTWLFFELDRYLWDLTECYLLVCLKFESSLGFDWCRVFLETDLFCYRVFPLLFKECPDFKASTIVRVALSLEAYFTSLSFFSFFSLFFITYSLVNFPLFPLLFSLSTVFLWVFFSPFFCFFLDSIWEFLSLDFEDDCFCDDLWLFCWDLCDYLDGEGFEADLSFLDDWTKPSGSGAYINRINKIYYRN
jgi:hypothetical protein